MNALLIPLTIYAAVMTFVAAVLANRSNMKVKELDKSDLFKYVFFTFKTKNTKKQQIPKEWGESK